MSSAPMSFRFAESDLAIIDRAARLRGHSRTRFVRDAAVREAEGAIFDATVVRLSAEDFALIEEQAASPAPPNEKLRVLLGAPSPWSDGK